MLLIQLIILMIAIFAGLVYVLREVLAKNISSATSHLDHMSAEFSRREEDIKKRQAEADKYYEQMVAEAKDEADRVRQSVDQSTKEDRDKILEQARLASEQVIEKAEKTKAMIIDELRRGIEEKVFAQIREMFNSIFPAHVQEAVHKLWFQDLLSGDLSRLNQMRVDSSINEIHLVTAFPLALEEKTALKKKFKEQLGLDFSFKETVDPLLVGGVRLTIGSIVLDGSVANKIEHVISAYV